MRKKIYTFTFVLFVISTSLYLVWAIAANIQKEAFKQYLSEVWSIDLNDEKITTDGFPFKFGIKVSNFRSPLRHIPLSLQFMKLEIVRLIYNFSDLTISYTEIFYNSLFTFLFYPPIWLIFNTYRKMMLIKHDD